MMAWRIGEILEPLDQFEWLLDHDFDSVGLHASAGRAGLWQGIAPADASPGFRHRLRDILARFRTREIHAPFECVVSGNGQTAGLGLLPEVLRFAGDLNVDVVTIHAEPPPHTERNAWDEMRQTCAQLDAEAERHGTRIGLETTRGFEVIRDWHLANVGLTLDVGHMFLNNAAPLAPYRSLANLVEIVGPALVNLHVHDVSADGVDHIELGTGIVPLHELPPALRAIGYKGSLCLELNPDRVSPAGIQRSRATLLQLIQQTTHQAI
jgi:sugar phosphate isomerase/epimerase